MFVSEGWYNVSSSQGRFRCWPNTISAKGNVESLVQKLQWPELLEIFLEYLFLNKEGYILPLEQSLYFSSTTEACHIASLCNRDAANTIGLT